MAAFEQIDTAKLAEMIAADESFLLLDVRTPEETAQGVIPGAKLLPLSVLPMHIDKIAADTKVVVYCLSGGRSAQASGFLAQNGIADVTNVMGGISSWAGGGQTVVAPADANNFMV